MSSREIKFRAKTLKQDTLCYGSYFKHIKRQVSPLGDNLKDEDIEHLMISDGFADWNMPRAITAILVNPNTVGQYTGERDIGGKEIYEGDIIEFNDVEYSDSPSQKFTVRSGEDFHRDCCYLQNINEYIDQYIKDNGEYPDDSIQVIGNIYDNPELIKECEW